MADPKSSSTPQGHEAHQGGDDRERLLRRISRLEFERDGYYGEWQAAKDRLNRFKRSPAWLVWLLWLLIGKLLIWPVGKGIELIAAAGRAGLRLAGLPYLFVSTTAARCRARRADEPTSIPEPAPQGAGDTGKKPRVLIVMPYSIYPPHHGGAVRLFNLIKRLSDRCDLYLLIFSKSGEDSEQRTALEPYCARVDFHHWTPSIQRDRFGLEPPSALLFRSDRARAKIVDIVVGFQIDVVQLEYTELGQYVSAVPRGVPVILTEHDIAFRSFDRRRRLAFNRRFPEGSAFGSGMADGRRLQRYEINWNEEADQIHTMSSEDARYIARYLSDGAARLRVVPNGVDAEFYAPPDDPPNRRDVLYVGNFQNLPNVDALEYLMAEIWPLIRQRCPDAVLTVVGANLSDRVQRFHGHDGVNVVGEVADLRHVYHGHRVMVAPIRAGSGTRLKILEACAAGLPVVTTTLGAEGLEYDDGSQMLTADGADAFAGAVERVLTDDELCRHLSRAGRELVREHYDWGRVADELWRCYREVLANIHPLTVGGDAGAIEIIEPDTAGEVAPVVSVLIPTSNGGEQLERCLGAIDDQLGGLATEIVCVDAGSPTKAVEAMKQHGARIVRIHETGVNRGLVLDLAARHSAGRLLVFVTQDAVPDGDRWLARLTEPLIEAADGPAAVQGGISHASDGEDGFYWDSCSECSRLDRATARWLKSHGGIDLSTVNCAMTKEMWQRHPFGWAPTMEDRKWQREIMDAGFEIVERSGASVYQIRDYDLRSLIRQCRFDGSGWRNLNLKYSLWDATRDMLKPGVYFALVKGILRGRVRTSAELLFPWIRPINLWWGNRISGGLRT